MSEKHDRLRSALQEFEAELAALGSLDDETRAELETLMREIADALSKKGADIRRSEGLAARLQDAAQDFENSHPTLFGIISRTIDALGQMGI
jgi:hypothetical protein